MSPDDLKYAKRNDPLMPQSRAKLGIPFISKDVPAPASEFAQPDVVIGLTMLAYRHTDIQGMRYDDFSQALGKLMADFQNESGPQDKRKSALLYINWVRMCGCCVTGTDDAEAARERKEAGGTSKFEREFLPLKLLDRSDMQQMEPLFGRFRRLPEFVHYYLEEITFPTFMRFQKQKLSASGEDMGGAILFKRRIGFSGESMLIALDCTGAILFKRRIGFSGKRRL